MEAASGATSRARSRASGTRSRSRRSRNLRAEERERERGDVFAFAPEGERVRGRVDHLELNWPAELARDALRARHVDERVRARVNHERWRDDLTETPANATDTADELARGTRRDAVTPDGTVHGEWEPRHDTPQVGRERDDAAPQHERRRIEQERARWTREREIERERRAGRETAQHDVVVLACHEVQLGEHRVAHVLPREAIEVVPM